MSTHFFLPNSKLPIAIFKKPTDPVPTTITDINITNEPVEMDIGPATLDQENWPCTRPRQPFDLASRHHLSPSHPSWCRTEQPGSSTLDHPQFVRRPVSGTDRTRKMPMGSTCGSDTTLWTTWWLIDFGPYRRLNLPQFHAETEKILESAIQFFSFLRPHRRPPFPSQTKGPHRCRSSAVGLQSSFPASQRGSAAAPSRLWLHEQR